MSSHHAQSDSHAQWPREAVVYQLYPFSFCDGNGDGWGDLAGIITHLDYLNDGTDTSLGVEALWLNPIYRSPMKDYGYDVSDYRDIDPVFGDLSLFDRFLKEAHARNIRVIMDFVPNHTSDQHPWFRESRSSKNNSKRDWYLWRDPAADGGPPNNWTSRLGGSAWTYDDATKQYYLHSFLDSQPDLNWRNEDVRSEMLDIMDFWLERGVDGFRIDAAYHLIKDDQFRDNPPNPLYDPKTDDPYKQHLQLYNQGRPELKESFRTLCGALDKHSGKYLVSEGEIFLDLSELAQFYSFCDSSKHGPFNFSLINVPWNARAIQNKIDEFESFIDEEDWPNYVLGNHDQPRIASRVGQSQARIAAMLLLTLRGLPFIYYGDEIGMTDTAIPEARQRDPLGQPPFEGMASRDPARTPLQWDQSTHAGFSSGEPWLPVNMNADRVNIEAQRADPSSILNLYRQLISLRKSSPALKTGTYLSAATGNDAVFAYYRICPAETLLVVLNFTEHEQFVSVAEKKQGDVLVSTTLGRTSERVHLNGIRLRRHEGLIVALDEPQ